MGKSSDSSAQQSEDHLSGHLHTQLQRDGVLQKHGNIAVILINLKHINIRKRIKINSNHNALHFTQKYFSQFLGQNVHKSSFIKANLDCGWLFCDLCLPRCIFYSWLFFITLNSATVSLVKVKNG